MAFEKPADLKVVASEIINRINEDTRRIRLLEQRIERTESRLSEIEKTVLTQMDDLKISLERIGNKINSISDKLATLENENLRINKALEKTVSKAEVKELEAFVEAINPITSKFATKDEIERMLEEKLRKKA
jgi:predicted  nucleic acid-binding Zn-ribbon protein